MNIPSTNNNNNNNPTTTKEVAIMSTQPQPKEKVMKVSDMPLLDGKFVIAGTGSRSLILDEGKMNKVQEYLIDLLTQAKAKHGNNLVVISGMAEGFDEALARAAMCVGVTLIAAIPNKGYSAYYWRNNSQLKVDRMDSFQELAGYAHRSGGVHYVCGKDIYVNGKHSNFVRNEWMADRADVVWVYNPISKGTAQCYNYCRTNAIKTFIINIDEGGNKNMEKPVKPNQPTPAPAEALVKLEKLDQQTTNHIISLLEKNAVPHLQADVSNYAKGRMRVWMPYEAPLDSPNSTDRPFIPGMMHDELWQFIVDLCAKHGFTAQLALASKGGSIKPHRDATYAAAWSFGINLGECDWQIASTRDSAKPDYSMHLTGGEVFKFNSKHTHAVVNAKPDRWAINVWAIANGNAANQANIQQRLQTMLDENPNVAEFIEKHKPQSKEKDMKDIPMFKQAEYEFLSNMYLVDINGYKCVESFFMAMKTIDESIRAQVRKMNGFEAKKFMRSVALRENWNDIRIDVMRYALKKKFAPNTELAIKLLATGDTRLVESNTWHDNFWGDCICEVKCSDINGKNTLGEMLMEIRNDLKDNGGGRGKDMPKTPSPVNGLTTTMKEALEKLGEKEVARRSAAIDRKDKKRRIAQGGMTPAEIAAEKKKYTKKMTAKELAKLQEDIAASFVEKADREAGKLLAPKEKTVKPQPKKKEVKVVEVPQAKEKEKPMNPIIEHTKREVAMHDPSKEQTFFHGIVKYDNIRVPGRRNDEVTEGGLMRVITTMALKDKDLEVLEEFKPGAYSFAFLDAFFPRGYRVEVRKLDQNEETSISAKPLKPNVLSNDTVIRWSTADDQFNVSVTGNAGWLDAFGNIGLVIGNSKKFAKRSQEFVRQSCMYGRYDKLDIEIMDPAVLGVDEKYVDGISAVSRTIMVNMIENNQNASDEWKESMIKRVESGKMSIVQLRVLTPQGLIKGNAIVLPDKMMNGYDIRTFTPNVKAEIKTDGWYWATAEASYGKLPLMSDDLTLAIYRDVMGVIDPWLLLSTLQNAMNELVDNYKNGSDSDWRREVAMNIGSEDDMDPNKKSMINRIDQLGDKLEEIGLGIESSQLLMYLKARGVAMMFGVLNAMGAEVLPGDVVTQRGVGTRMPIPFAYRAHVMTREVLEIFGYKFNNKGMQGFYHDKTHCFVVPGEFFVENYPNHGGPDLDDSINVIIRDFVDAAGKRSYKALLMRNPNDFGEWSAIPVAPKEIEHCYHTYGNVPTVIEAELRAKVEQLSIMLKNDTINYRFNELPGASGLTIGDVYHINDEVRMREAASAMPGGTGATVLPKMTHYAITGEVITKQLVSNEQIIDAVQQGLGTPSDMKLITDSGNDFYRDIAAWMDTTGGRIDQYWTRTKRIPNRVGIQFGFWGKDFTCVAEKKDSPILQTMLTREAIVREAYKELLEWANKPLMPHCIANMEMDIHERKLAASEFAQITQWFYAVTADGTTKDWAKKLVDTLKKSDEEKGEAYTDRKILRLFRQGFIAKTAKPMGNHDKWLFVVNPELDQLPIDWLIRAYKRFIMS